MPFQFMKNTRVKNLMFEVEDKMNKLMGFYELKSMNIPAIPWEEYTGTEFFSSNNLWTIRSAVFRGNDLELPRLVGALANEAKEFADELLRVLKNRGIVIYYPYFLANKSGTLNVFSDRVVIEAVKNDLWNLVTYSDREVTIEIYNDGTTIVNGNGDFLTESELKKIVNNVKVIKKSFRDDLLEGKSALLEWSLAQKSNLIKEPIGEEFLVFYEVRTLN